MTSSHAIPTERCTPTTPAAPDVRLISSKPFHPTLEDRSATAGATLPDMGRILPECSSGTTTRSAGDAERDERAGPGIALASEADVRGTSKPDVV